MRLPLAPPLVCSELKPDHFDRGLRDLTLPVCPARSARPRGEASRGRLNLFRVLTRLGDQIFVGVTEGSLKANLPQLTPLGVRLLPASCI